MSCPTRYPGPTHTRSPASFSPSADPTVPGHVPGNRKYWPRVRHRDPHSPRQHPRSGPHVPPRRCRSATSPGSRSSVPRSSGQRLLAVAQALRVVPPLISNGVDCPNAPAAAWRSTIWIPFFIVAVYAKPPFSATRAMKPSIPLDTTLDDPIHWNAVARHVEEKQARRLHRVRRPRRHHTSRPADTVSSATHHVDRTGAKKASGLGAEWPQYCRLHSVTYRHSAWVLPWQLDMLCRCDRRCFDTAYCLPRRIACSLPRWEWLPGRQG